MTEHPPLTDDCPARFCVLASSSKGNCSAIVTRDATGQAGVVLIDLGLSPRRTRAALEQAGLGGLPLRAVLMTHLDSDHWNSAWLADLPESTTVFLHKRHAGRADRLGLLYLRTHLYDSMVEPLPNVVVGPYLNAHDDLGSVSFRIGVVSRASGLRSTLGYATDVGRVTPGLLDHLRGVRTLAIESNYCPRMQQLSTRPQFLKDRITNGRGHLSNDESAHAVRAIAPRETVVLLHLSQECNTPDIAIGHHQHEGRRVMIAPPDAPSAVLPLLASDGCVVEVPRAGGQIGLWARRASIPGAVHR